MKSRFLAVAVGAVILALGAAAPAAQETKLTREEILKQGPPALEKHCIGCHLADKWEGTSRDREGWTAIVDEMAKLAETASKPKMDEKTYNLVIDYLTLTRPQ